MCFVQSREMHVNADVNEMQRKGKFPLVSDFRSSSFFFFVDPAQTPSNATMHGGLKCKIERYILGKTFTFFDEPLLTIMLQRHIRHPKKCAPGVGEYQSQTTVHSSDR